MCDDLSVAIDDSTGGGDVAAHVAAAGLSRVVVDHPAAVLLVDLDTRSVTYANTVASQLAPDVQLPVDVDAWSRAAALRDAQGDPLDEGLTSLRRVAEGDPVRGEQVTARLRSDLTAAREDMWVVGMPLADAPAPLDRRALVVFLPLRDHAGVAQAQQSGTELQHRAIISSEVSFSISDPHAEDDPLVWVNPAFEAITGYRAADVIGTNCRFLQGPRTDPAAIDRIRTGLAQGGAVTETLLNYRADGTAFWNHIVISPIYDAEGRLTHHVGVQSDVTERVEAGSERDRALREAESANGRMAALAAISAELAEGLDTGATTMAKLPPVVARHFTGWVLAAGLANGTLTRVTVTHSDPALHGHGEQLGAAVSQWATSGAARGVVRMLIDRLTKSGSIDTVVAPAIVPTVVSALDVGALGIDKRLHGPLVVVPLVARGRFVGMLGMLGDGDRPRFDPAEIAAVVDLGVRAGVALDNARLYEQEHNAALLLQRSLLPRLPELTGFDLAATYQPARNQAEVGGDWYDVLDLPDGKGVAVAIGDVMGHDLRAAAEMGQLRSVLRSLAWTGGEPREVVARADELTRGLAITALATCAYAVVCPQDDGSCSVVYTLAGHPPPIIRLPDGRVERLDGAVTSPIGVADRRDVPQATTDLPIGAYLVLYTDGLIERRHRDLDAGLDDLTRVIAGAPSTSTAAELCALVVDTLTSSDHDDDVCVLVLRRSA